MRVIFLQRKNNIEFVIDQCFFAISYKIINLKCYFYLIATNWFTGDDAAGVTD